MEVVLQSLWSGRHVGQKCLALVDQFSWLPGNGAEVEAMVTCEDLEKRERMSLFCSDWSRQDKSEGLYSSQNCRAGRDPKPHLVQPPIDGTCPLKSCKSFWSQMQRMAAEKCSSKCIKYNWGKPPHSMTLLKSYFALVIMSEHS